MSPEIIRSMSSFQLQKIRQPPHTHPSPQKTTAQPTCLDDLDVAYQMPRLDAARIETIPVKELVAVIW